MGTGTAEWEADANGEGSGGRGEKGVHCSRMCRSTGRSTRGTVPIRFGTYNIRNGRNGGLESALRGMSQANMDLGVDNTGRPLRYHRDDSVVVFRYYQQK